MLFGVLFGLSLLAVFITTFATARTKPSTRIKIRLSIVGAALLVCCIVSVSKIQRAQSHVVNPEAFEVIEVGMTKEQVADLLGEPPKRELAIWTYKEPGVFEFAEVYFDDNGRVKEKVLDR
jgi:hypothetical protein